VWILGPETAGNLISLASLTLLLHQQLPDDCIYDAIIMLSFVEYFTLQLHIVSTVVRL
jgi:hypothetical protein